MRNFQRINKSYKYNVKKPNREINKFVTVEIRMENVIILKYDPMAIGWPTLLLLSSTHSLQLLYSFH